MLGSFLFLLIFKQLQSPLATQPELKVAEVDQHVLFSLDSGQSFLMDVYKDLEYRKIDNQSLKLDLYIPPHEHKIPLVVWIHGGAWLGGDKLNPPAVPLLTQNGFAVASIRYRFSQDALFPAQIEDCKAAIRWLKAHANEYGFDPERVGAWGASAGGHLVALLGTMGDVNGFDNGQHLDQSSEVHAVCDWFGPTDFLQMDAHAIPNSRIVHDLPGSPESKLVGGPIQENKRKVKNANPISYVSRNDPPFLIMHGKKDLLVPYHQSLILHGALEKVGVESQLLLAEDLGHGGPNFRTSKVMDMVLKFFKEKLKGD